MDDGRLQLARAAFDKAIAARADTFDPFYGAVFAPFCSAMLLAGYPTWNESSLKKPTMISIARQDCLPTHPEHENGDCDKNAPVGGRS